MVTDTAPAQVARAAVAAGAAELGVATVNEALALRAEGLTAPILAWLHPPGIDFGPALLADVQIAVSSARQLDELLGAVRRTGRTAAVTLKVDTGLKPQWRPAGSLPVDADRVAPSRRRGRHPAARPDVAHGLRRPAQQSDQ